MTRIRTWGEQRPKRTVGINRVGRVICGVPEQLRHASVSEGAQMDLSEAPDLPWMFTTLRRQTVEVNERTLTWAEISKVQQAKLKEVSFWVVYPDVTVVFEQKISDSSYV